MAVLFLFIDGVGLGPEGSSNPFVDANYKGFTAMAGGHNFTIDSPPVKTNDHLFKGIDANLGVEGLPQSGTGQTALFTGENASQKIGKHFGPFPHSGIKTFLKEESIFHRAQERGKQCQFMNAYPDIFFKKARERDRWSCTTLMTKSANLALNSVEEVKEGKALTAEITQQAWRDKLGIDVPHVSPESAADRLLEQSKKYDLLLHEYYLTDKAGHSQEMKKAHKFLSVYDRFLWHLINHKPRELTIVLSSDHGNVEDLSIKTHTRNEVPLFVYGPGANSFEEAKSIMDVTPGIVEILI
ncbi:alkaline phosphatase family protein [Fodinibius saliphilus]|uniref:alkaline phosphatase family protein n=1 Tax=Fodinibius saliphilus TaxID=1920650 RepID=UPI0011087B07|nr:alkaline phosphatase family protein [Fodinibius saliphilus]